MEKFLQDASASDSPDYKRDDKKREKYKEQKLSDASRCACDAAKSERRSDDGEDEECECPTEHDDLLYVHSV